MVVSSYAVAHPRAVMVHPFNAGIALFAVMHPWQFDNIAFLAKSRFLQLSDFLRAKSIYWYSSSNLLLFLRYLFFVFIASALSTNLAICSSENCWFFVKEVSTIVFLG